MRRRQVIIGGVLLTLAAVVFIGGRVGEPLARPALGFAAKVVCSAVFVGGEAEEQASAAFPDEPIAKLLRTRVDHRARRVVARFPLIATRTAVHHEQLGCTLEPVAPFPALPPRPLPLSNALWPDGENIDVQATTPALNAVLDSAFAEPDAALRRNTRAIVIVHRGRIIAERYGAGHEATTRMAGWSMTKSVTSALVGILAGEGRLSLKEADLRPEWRDAFDPRHGITLGQLMHMSSGLEFDESYAPAGEATRMLFAAHDADSVAATSPLMHEPGTVWYYSSGTTNLIAQRIRDVFMDDDVAYFTFPRRALFDRIGMHSAVIEPDPSGTFVGSSFMYATARDWARFGMLYLQDGTWNGERILPEGWVQYSVTPFPYAPLGEYGAQWWLNAGEAADTRKRRWPDLPRDIFYAAGFQGQYLVVVPSHELVVVRLGMTHDDRAWSLGGFLRSVIDALPH